MCVDMHTARHVSGRWGRAPLLFLGGHAGAPAPTSTSASAPRHAGGICLPPLCPGRCGEPGGPGGPGGPGRAQRTGSGRGPGDRSSDRCLCVLLGARAARGSMKPRRRALFSQRSGTNSTGSAAPLPLPPALTAGHALAPPPHPPFLSWPGRCSADGMRQRLLERRFIPCWAGTLRGAWPAPGGGARLSRGRGHCWAAWPSPRRRGPPLSTPLPRRAPRHSSGPPRSRAISSSGQNQHPVCSLTEGSAVWRIFPCFI